MNIVTIDFDIIMHWSLNIYNNEVGGEDETVTRLLMDNPNSAFIPRCDFGMYEYLTSFILKCFKKLPKDNIIFIDDHDDVADLFDPDSEIIKPQDECYIYNIDFHHDIAYDEDEIENEVEEIDCGNWVKYLFETYPTNLKQYIWIKAKESESYDDDEDEEIYFSCSDKIGIQEIDKYNLDALVKKVDYLYLCKSPEWVPSDVHFLYEVWQDMYEEFYQ